jgi:hypothetical protein
MEEMVKEEFMDVATSSMIILKETSGNITCNPKNGSKGLYLQCNIPQT